MSSWKQCSNRLTVKDQGGREARTFGYLAAIGDSERVRFMLEMPWLDEYHIPNGRLEGALELANQLYWNLTVERGQEYWVVFSGEKAILRTDSQDVLDAFLYGLGLAYGCLPIEIFARLKEHVKELVE